MSRTSFCLIAYGASTPDFGDISSLHGQLSVDAGSLQITYQLEADLSKLTVPVCSGPPQRQDLLWQGTCLELFLAGAGQSDYWEFNLSPAGHWNVYHLDGYRQGMAEEPAYKQLPFSVKRDNQQLSLSLTCALPPALATPRAAAGLELAATAVIKSASGELTYWALNHPGSKPDFHHRGGFCLKLS